MVSTPAKKGLPVGGRTPVLSARGAAPGAVAEILPAPGQPYPFLRSCLFSQFLAV